jgi:hypothetical protein
MKKFFWRFSILTVLLFSLYAFRHFFIGTVLEFGLKRATGNSISYNNRYWEDGRLFYEGFSLGQQVYAEEAAFDFDFHLSPFSINAAVHLDSPTVQLNDTGEKSNLAFLLPAKFWTVKLDIEKGTLLSAEKNLCLFDFASGNEKEDIGTFSIYQEDGAPLFTCAFNYRSGSLAADFQMEDAPLDKTLPLVSLFYPLPSWKLLEGTASAAIKGSIDVEQVTFLQGYFSLQNVRLESDDLIFAADKASSMIDFQGEIETFALDTDFNGVDLFWKDLEVLHGEGSIVFKPEETPIFEAHAAVHIADLEGRADVVGKGEIHDNHSLWLEGTLDYVTAHSPLRVEFSWADDGKAQVLQTQIHNLGKEILGLLNTRFPWSIRQGSLDGQATAYLDQGIFDRLQLDNIKVHQLSIDNLTIRETELQGSLNLLSGDIEQLIVQAHDAEGEIQGWRVSSAEMTIAIQDNNFEPSSAFGKFEGVPFALQWQGPLSSFHASAKLSAGASEWMKLSKNAQEPPIILDLILDRKQEELQIQGTLACLEDTVQLSAQANISSAVLKGGFQSTRLQSSFYTPFLKIFAPTLVMQGDLSLHGQFSEKTIDILTQGDDLIVTSPEFQLSILGQSRELLYHFDFHEKQGTGKVKLSPILFTSPQLSLPISITSGELVFDNTSLSCQGVTGQISGIDIQGDLAANWEEQLEASFLSQKIQGSLESLITIAAPFYKVPVAITGGLFTCPPEGVQVHYANGIYNYRFDSLFEKVEGTLTSKLHVQNTSCTLAFDSFENQLIVQNIKGTLSGDFTFSAQEICYKNGQWDFNAALGEGERTLLSLQGKAIETTLGYQVTLQEAKASASYLKGPLSFHWTPPYKMEQVQGVVYIDTTNLAEQLSLLDRLGLFSFTTGMQETLKQLQGSMTLRLIIDEDCSEYEVQGSQVRYASTLFDSVDVHLIRQGNQWSLNHCSLDDIQIRGQAAFQNAKWVVSVCDIDWKGLKVHTAGIYEKEKFDFKVEGQLSLRFSLKGNGIFFSPTSHFQNLYLKVFDQADPLASVSCDKLNFRNGRWESPVLDLTILSKQLSEPLRSKLQFSLSSKSTTFQGPASQGKIKLGEGTLKITQIYGLYEAPYLNLKCVATLDDEPLHFLAKFSKDHQFGGGVNIQRGKEVLKLSFSDPSTCQKAEGELFGINVNLQRDAQGFKGTILFKDTAKIAALTDNESFKDFSGLQLTGLFTQETFKGELEGHDARLKDYLIHGLHASVDYSPTRFQLKNLTLQDPAGSLAIKECNGFRTTALDKWNITIPLIKGQEIKPSIIRKLGASQKEIKPLQIRYFLMTDVLGQLGDLKSFRGLGKFNFTQHVKKEPSLFDIPLALLKDFGLDLDMFSPMMGEVQIQLKDGKLFFTDLQNAFSEGKRSEFYLAGEPSYIDLNGGLYLNLRMQQNVVLKLVEPFMIAVRGTWEKPKYSLQ